ncbi:MAG: FdrA family protein [Acidimicrobiia bacterium]|nr:FdrA family protein [Acidimicrobiia bacterium]
MIENITVQSGRYHDSVRLMQASQVLRNSTGVEEALVAMGTELNLSLLEDLGFDPQKFATAGPNDLIIAVRAIDEPTVASLGGLLEEALTPRTVPGGDELPPNHVVETAAASIGANLALISVPGRYAFVEAMSALRAGLHVMIFSDNVSIEHEVILKEEAAGRDLLVMGPDCGTSIIGGVGLGFANAVQPGSVSLVGASGTGIQQLTCLLDDAGVGIRHAWGTGSRDLSEAVGGSSTLRGLAALDADPGTEVIVVVSKPPAPEVAAAVRTAAAGCTTPVVVAFMEPGSTLESAANAVLEKLGKPPVTYSSWPVAKADRRPGFLRGYFSGGTLRDEARFILEPVVGSVSLTEASEGAWLVDYGDDEYTEGRAHPMIDQTVRLERLQSAVDDESVGIVLLDVVLGHGANPDPSAELAPVIRSLTGAGAAVVANLCGSQADPQGLQSQANQLHEAGAAVYLSNAAAAARAAELVGGAA